MWLCRTIARSPALCSGGMADSEEIQSPVETAPLQGEVRGGDRRGEAVIEGLGQVQCLVEPVPAQPDRDLVEAQLARVEEAEQLDPGEMRLAEGAELLGAVLVHVPGVVRLLCPRRGQREQVGR